ncbi:serine/threonine-protein kinase [Myxococcus qinghaiensis]|uniref:serine/threonine-protein kinase n=1 Tax=Myxococcus qinghaiensis TaxID=2906758 RepID=UPI0020A80220|nr:serine/threonine-protein kinase [Myxococcus qinghaiensis]MCP3161898.1 protein kinase [Myxococcus qinghaiensis]
MALQPGDKFGRYELVSWLGRGGMAETWRARWTGDAGVTKSVLIKKVLPEFAEDEAFISMFINEARISATLSHGNIAQVFDFGRVEGQYYLAMELVDGQPLHHVLKRAVKTGLQRMPVPLAVYIALEMCRGLHYAHTRADDKGTPLDIVHRDISPDNVLISYEGQVKIVDFGIAKAQMARNFKTEPGVVKGKYLFFSPEQARGHEVDARTDIWATGLVLYELLCGQLPVTGTQAAVMMRMAHGEFPSPRQVRADLPYALDEIVMRALAVDLDERYESANAFADALAQFLYSHAPRFSTMNLAYLVRVLFRGEMATEGRELSVPPSFIDELTVWRASGAPPEAPPKQERAKAVSSRAETEMELDLKSGAQRPTRKLLPAAEAVDEVHPTVEALEAQAPATSTSTHGGMMGWGAMAGFAAVLVMAVGAFYAFVIAPQSAGRPRPLPPMTHGPPTPDVPISPNLQLPPPEENPPGATKADVRQARALLERGNYRAASAMAEKCLAFVENHPDCLLIAGASMARLEKFDVAVQRYQALVRHHPGHPLAETTRTLMGEYERMHAEKSALKPLSPDVSPPLAGTTRPKVEEPRKTTAPPPSTPGASTEIVRTTAAESVTQAREFIKKQKYTEALAVAENCARIWPSYAECRLMLGISKARLGRLDEGAMDYQTFLDLAPHDHPSREGVTKLLRQFDDRKLMGR